MNKQQFDNFLSEAKNILRSKFTNEEFRDIIIDVLLAEKNIEPLGYINKLNNEEKEQLSYLTRKYNVLDSEQNTDLFSTIFEFTLSDAGFLGEFYTPKSLVELLPLFFDQEQTKNATFVDITCGTGSMLVNTKHENTDDNFFIGFELNEKSSKICEKNLLFNNLKGEVINTDVLDCDTEECVFNILYKEDREEQPLFVIANPPYNLKNPNTLNEFLYPLGIPPKNNMNFAFIQIILNLLYFNKQTKACVIMPNSTLSTTNKAEVMIKSKIIDNDWLDCIIALPNKLFYGTSIPVCLWILDKNKPKERKGNVLFIDAKEIYTPINKKQNELTEDNRQEIKRLYELRGRCIDYSTIVPNKQIKQNEYNLNPSKFIEYSTEEQSTESVNEKMNRLNAELAALFNESEKLQRKILKNMQSVLNEVNKND